MAVMGLRRDDILSMTPEEFSLARKFYIDRRKAESYERWNLMRTHASIVIQPHCKRKLTPQQLLPLPGDKPQKKPRTRVAAQKGERSSAERFGELVSGTTR